METAINKELRIRNRAYSIMCNLDVEHAARYTACSLWLMNLRDDGEISERDFHIYMADALRIEEEVNALHWKSALITPPLLQGYYYVHANGVIYTARYNPADRTWHEVSSEQEIGGRVTYWANLPAQSEEVRK